MQSREEPLLFEALGILQDSSESQMGVSFAMFSEPKIDTVVGDCVGGCNSQCDSSTQKRDSVVLRSVSFKGNEGVTTVLRSVSLEGGESSEATILKSAGVRKKMVVEGSVGFKKSDSDSHSVDTNVAVQRHGVVETESTTHKKTESIAESFLDSPKHDAAVKLQKVYRSFRTRRNLADCAVLVNQLWWMALDFATLKLNSVSFFDIDKPESAVSRWSRARVRAAMVGRGLSKDEKAQKLALQHWLEAIDPRHRYGHNLHFYYDMWLDCDSKQPFFYWLDIGEGKEFNIAECPRCRLQQQCILYLGPNEREAYEVIVREGKFVYRKSGKLLDTSEGGEGAKWIFVLSTSRVMYVGQKKKGTFQHSSFLAGGATSSAGRLVVLKGILKSVWPYSGHYRPTEHNFQEFVSFLEENGVDLRDVKKSPEVWEEEISLERSESLLMSISSESDLSMDDECEPLDEDCVGISEAEPSEETTLEENSNTLMVFGGSPVTKRPVSVAHRRRFTVCNISSSALNWREDESEEAREQRFLPHDKRNLFDEEEERAEIQVLRKESILQRINSKKGIVSYQLGKQLSCKWTTGSGPRIGFVRDHPSELRCRALEQVHLSPRSTIHRSRFALSPRPTLE